MVGPVETTTLTAEPAATPVPEVGLWLMTLPEATVEFDSCVTTPSASPAPVIAEVAAACVRPTTLGTATGPVETTRDTAEPVATVVPEPGFWLITLPATTVVLDACEIVPTTRFAPMIAVVAAVCV